MKEIQFKIDGKHENIIAYNSELCLTNKHYITEKPLQWNYKNNSEIVIKRKIINREHEIRKEVVCAGIKYTIDNPPFGFFCRVYCESPSNTVLTFSFCQGDQTDCYFEYKLDFYGWKELPMPYTRGFLNGNLSENADALRISASTSESGTVFFDDFYFCKYIDGRFIYNRVCAQIPKLNTHVKKYPNLLYEKYGNHLNEPVFSIEKEVSEKQKQDLNTILMQYLEICDECDIRYSYYEMKGYSIPSFKEAIQLFQSYNIKHDNGFVTGESIRDKGEYASGLKSLAVYCNENPTMENEQLYIKALLHLRDQNKDINGYNGRGIATSILLMREVLRKNNLLDTAIDYIRTAYDYNRIYNVTSNAGIVGSRFEDSDVTGTTLSSLLACVLIEDDSPEKVRDMKHFKYYFENFCLGYAPGIITGYKPDGTVFHHGSYIRQYQIVPSYSIARVLYILSGTMFMPNEAAIDRYLNELETEYIIYNGVWETFALSQYGFKPFNFTSVSDFADTAIALKDKDLAAKYLRLAEVSKNEVENNKHYQQFINQGIKPAPLPSTHKTLTYSAACFHRRDDWTVAVRGYGKYIYVMEIWSDDIGAGLRYSAFSLFRSFGFMEILHEPEYEGGTNNGIEIDKGFDYTRWSGSTAVHLPYEMLKSQPLINDDEWAEWLYSDQGFVGGLDSSDKNGVFALQLHGPQKYNLNSFRANKTYHFYDDKILCIGSGISCDLDKYDTETTLFQDYGTGAIKDEKILMDNRNNAYYIFDNKEVSFFEKENTSRDLKDLMDTKGLRTFALISHGKAPKNDSYAYLTQIDTTVEKVKQEKPWDEIEIIQRDDTAHIVKIGNRTDYVMFIKTYNINVGIVESISESCIVSVTESKNELSLSVADPDLHLYSGESGNKDLYGNEMETSIYGNLWRANESIKSRIWIVLNKRIDELKIVNGNAKMIEQGENHTILEFICQHGLTNEIKAEIQ